jgi:hypothetical protein
MNKRTYTHIIYVTAALLILSLSTCMEEPDSGGGLINGGSPVLKNDSIGTVKAHSIEVFATITKQNGALLDSCGFNIVKAGTTDTIRIPAQNISGKSLPIRFNATINNLQYNTAYHITSYACNNQGRTVGDLQTVTTLDGLGQISTNQPENIKGTSAVLAGRITSLGEAKAALSYGIILSKSKDMTSSLPYPASALANNAFNVKISSLDTTATYYYQAYAVTEYGTFTGDTLTFTTLDGKPRLSKLSVQDVLFTTASYSASVIDEGDSSVVQKGICWAISPSIPSIDSCDIIISSEESISGTIDSLTAGIQYNARAYAINHFGTEYSETASFSTKNDESMVIINSIHNVSDGGALASGRVISSGNGTIVQGGFCWSSTDTLPNITHDSISIVSPIGDLSDFSGAITKLKGSTTYYVRAYIVNSKGKIGYSSTRVISTPLLFDPVVSFPGDIRIPNSVSTFTIAGGVNTTYVLGGDKGSSLSDELWAYNISGRWDRMRDFPAGPRKWQTTVVANNWGYTFGGVDAGNTPNNSIYCYKPSSNTWEEIKRPSTASLWPTPVHSATGIGYYYSIFFIGGNRNGTISDEVWLYETVYSRWERKNNFPVKQYKGIGLCNQSTGMFYAGFGLTDPTGTSSEKRLWSWSNRTSEDVWKLETTFPGEGQVRSAVLYKTTIYLIDDDGQIWSYDIPEKKWTKKSLLPPSNRGDYQHTMFILDYTIYIGFGPSYRSLIKYDHAWDN